MSSDNLTVFIILASICLFQSFVSVLNHKNSSFSNLMYVMDFHKKHFVSSSFINRRKILNESKPKKFSKKLIKGCDILGSRFLISQFQSQYKQTYFQMFFSLKITSEIRHFTCVHDIQFSKGARVLCCIVGTKQSLTSWRSIEFQVCLVKGVLIVRHIRNVRNKV